MLIKMGKGLLWLLPLLSLAGCLNNTIVTTRPEYAYPHRLTSLCGRESDLVVFNRGNFVTGDYTNKSTQLLLSQQLTPLSPDLQRRIDRLVLHVGAAAEISIELILDEGSKYRYTVEGVATRCEESGELVINYPSDSFYFWATVGNRSRELALWTNSDAELILHNRWRETHKGIVGAEFEGDAWAIFERAEPVDSGEGITQPIEALINAVEPVECLILTGKFNSEGESITPDGAITTRGAVEHFFREEIIGNQPINQHKSTATTLELIQDQFNAVTIHIYDGNDLLATRLISQEDIQCVDGRWQYRGDKRPESGWLLLAASGGIYWEDMTLWLDNTGNLQVSGVYKMRGALLLVPFARTEKSFIFFARQ